MTWLVWFVMMDDCTERDGDKVLALEKYCHHY